jgi:tetratricopeptide (TPR) repeat protein
MEQDPGRDEALAAVRGLASKPEVAGNALNLLEEYYRGAGELEAVVELYEQRVELAPSDADRVVLLTEAAELWEHELERPERALLAMRDAVLADPRDRGLIESLERLAELSGRWEDLGGLVEDIAANADLDRRELYELRLRSAGWYRDRMDDPTRAERALSEALASDPEPIEAHEQLVALFRAQERKADLVASLRAWSEVEPDTAKRIALLREAAELARKELAQPELAAEHYQALIGIDREDVEGLRSLAEIRSEQGRWNEVVGLLERLLDLVPSDERPGIARAMGEAYRDHLGDPREAIRSYETALELDSVDLSSMDALEALYRDSRRFARSSRAERSAPMAPTGPRFSCGSH